MSFRSLVRTSYRAWLRRQYSVRAYDVSAVSGDTGALATAEMRRDLGTARDGQWQAVAFMDSAHATLNKTAWVAGRRKYQGKTSGAHHATRSI